jgi:cytochrome P450
LKLFTDEPNENIVGYEAVRNAAKDYESYSSDLQGDRDVRDYRQIPLEMDPPAHTDYRHAIQPLFLRPKIEAHGPAFESVAREILSQALEIKGELEVYNQIALPFVVGCLSIIYNRPQDLAEWTSWGPDVWTAASPERSGDVLHGYLERAYSEPSDQVDIWSYLKKIDLNGRPITFDEFRGYASVLLAGGRDTVIKLVAGIIWHLLQSKTDLEAIENDFDLSRNLIAELLRFLSPLPAIERIQKSSFDPEKPTYLRLHFASANYDESVWEKPGEVNINRGRQPHMAFGYGPHTCIGMNMAEFEAKAFIKTFLPVAREFEVTNFELVWDMVEGIEFLKDLKNLKIARR